MSGHMSVYKAYTGRNKGYTERRGTECALISYILWTMVLDFSCNESKFLVAQFMVIQIFAAKLTRKLTNTIYLCSSLMFI